MQLDTIESTTIVTIRGSIDLVSFNPNSKDLTLTIRSHWHPKRWSHAQNDARKYILEDGDQKQSRILGVLYIAVVQVYCWRLKPVKKGQKEASGGCLDANIPWLRLDSLEGHELSKDAYGYLTKQGS